jgi:site-specific DNA recombinase
MEQQATSPAIRRYRNRTRKPTARQAEIASGKKLAAIYLRVSTEKQVKREVDPQGLSVPDQRQATTRRASELGATVEAEFVELAETAKVLDRPELQRLLNDDELLSRIDFVIVFNLSRFARQLEDQIQVMRFLRARGVELVSATEHIDETPAGKFMVNVMGAMNQYHSDNSAFGAIRGMTQKAKVGGTPGRAPMGYRNVAREIDGRLVKTVEVDEDRAEHIQWAFETYATGEWTVRQLTEALKARGLVALPHGERPASPLQIPRVAHLLNNRYYTGVVTFRGVEYPGRHEPLISKDLFERVQEVLRSHSQALEKQRVHHHYLKGTVFCDRCRSRLCLTLTKGKYLYFFCVGRHQRRTSCQAPYLRVEAVEAAIEDHYRAVSVDPGTADNVRKALIDELERQQAGNKTQIARQERRLRKLGEERRKLLQAHYADAIPLELLKEEQARISRETAAAERQLAEARVAFADVAQTVERALDLATNLHQLYLASGGLARRRLNQFFFSKVLVGPDHVQVQLSEPAGALYEYAATQAGDAPLPDAGLYLRRGFERPTSVPYDRSSKMTVLAPPAGFEPAT